MTCNTDIFLTGWIHPVSTRFDLLSVDFWQKPIVFSMVQRTQKTLWANLNDFLLRNLILIQYERLLTLASRAQIFVKNQPFFKGIARLKDIQWKHFDFGLSGADFCQKPAVLSKVQRTQKTLRAILNIFLLRNYSSYNASILIWGADFCQKPADFSKM